MNTASNWQHHLNRQYVVLSRVSIYAVESMHYANLTKNGKNVNVRVISECDKMGPSM